MLDRFYSSPDRSIVLIVLLLSLLLALHFSKVFLFSLCRFYTTVFHLSLNTYDINLLSVYTSKETCHRKFSLEIGRGT